MPQAGRTAVANARQRKPPRNAVETEEAVSARAEKGSGNHEGLESTEAIGTLLNPANDTVTRFTSLIHNRFASSP